MKWLMLTTVLFSFFWMSCRHDIHEPDCACNNMGDIGGGSKFYGTQEAMIKIDPPTSIGIMPKNDFVGGGSRYILCTDSFMLKQIALKNIKNGDSVILKGIKAYPDGTCNVFRTRTVIINYNGVDLPLPMIRATDIEKK